MAIRTTSGTFDMDAERHGADASKLEAEASYPNLKLDLASDGVSQTHFRMVATTKFPWYEIGHVGSPL